LAGAGASAASVADGVGGMKLSSNFFAVGLYCGFLLRKFSWWMCAMRRVTAAWIVLVF